MDILGDYEFGMLDKPMLRRGEVHKPASTASSEQSVHLGQIGDFLNTGDMLDPTITANASVSPPPVGTVLAGSAVLLALLLITYKRMFSGRKHPHAHDDPLLSSTSSS